MRKNITDPEQRCEALVYDMYGEKIKGRCENRRHFIINGKELCGRHAALEALHVEFQAGRVRIIALQEPKLYGEVRTDHPGLIEKLRRAPR